MHIHYLITQQSQHLKSPHNTKPIYGLDCLTEEQSWPEGF